MTDSMKQNFKSMLRKQRSNNSVSGPLYPKSELDCEKLVKRIKKLFPNADDKLIIYYIKTSRCKCDDKIFEEISKIFVNS